MRSAILIRRSKDDGTEVPEEVMLSSCLVYLEKEGYECDVSQDAYIDIGETGGSVVASKADGYGKKSTKVESPSDRPAVKRLLSRLDRYQAVTIYKFDRLSRDQFTVGEIPTILIANGVKVMSPLDGIIDPENPESKFTFNMKAYLGEAERINTRKRTMDATRSMKAQGKIVGNGRPRYGYMYERLGPGKRAGRRRVIDEAKAAIVKRIFTEIAAGRGQRGVAVKLAKEGIPSPHGGNWSPWTIRTIITEPSYKGTAMIVDKWQNLNIKVRSKDGKTYGKRQPSTPKPLGDETPVIVTEELWNKANEKLSARSIPKHPGRRFETWLRGRIYCECCGKRMNMDFPYNEWNAICGGIRTAKCYMRARLADCEEVAWKALQQAFDDPESLRRSLMLESEDEAINQVERTIAHLEAEHTALKTKVSNLVDLIESSTNPTARDAYETRLNERAVEIEGNRRTLETTRSKLRELMVCRTEAETILERIEAERPNLATADEATKNRMADMVGCRVYVGKSEDGTAKIIGGVCAIGVPEDSLGSSLETLSGKYDLIQVLKFVPAGKGNYDRPSK